MAKTLMVVFNFVFLLCGIGICVLSFGTPKTYNDFIDGLNKVNYVFLAVGVVISLMAFLGCCGALMENSFMITTFILLLTSVLIAEIAIGGVAFAKRGDIEDTIKKAGIKMINSTDKSQHEIINDIQQNLHCCGMTGVDDYTGGMKVPPSCCEKHVDTCSKDSGDLYKTGCYQKIADQINSHLLYIGIAALVVIFVEILGLIFACCLRGAVREKYESV